ncbi:MAG TPA: AMP-binding protein [Pseudonocardiaceae bacterium]|nr:AMP-binding protein [Pseudonocardiaceae bacterium]
MGSSPLLPTLHRPTDGEALRFGQHSVTHRELSVLAAALQAPLAGARRVAVWAAPQLQTCVAVVAALAAGVPAVPINPKLGTRELQHVVSDAGPDLVLAASGATLPATLRALPRLDVDLRSRGGPMPSEPDPEAPALIVYTSGTTGPPKGVVLPRRALAADVDALASAWGWTDQDVLVHGLPLFHVHGLVLGVIGSLRLGGAVHHLGSFSVEGTARELAGCALDDRATMLFGVPTMYHRLAAAAEQDSQVAAALGRARLLVSGSAALPVSDHQRIAAATGQHVVQRYGMTESLITCAVRADGQRRPGTVGPPLDAVVLRLVDERGAVLQVTDDETVGEIEVAGPTLFLGYLNRPDATAEAMHDGWFRTGDIATRGPDGHLRLLGRRATDLISSGGYKIGTGEIENALQEHPDVSEAAVTGQPDPDLGERVVAWVVAACDPPPTAQQLADHVAELLAPHKRPRVVHYLPALPRNEMGKVCKSDLRPISARSGDETH